MSPGEPRRAQVTVVDAPACHLCEDAARGLEELSARFPFDVEHVDGESPRGRELTSLHRPALSPLVLLDGEFFSQGRLPRRKLAKVLATEGGRT